jgi:hypothetical protein
MSSIDSTSIPNSATTKYNTEDIVKKEARGLGYGFFFVYTTKLYSIFKYFIIKRILHLAPKVNY